MEALKKILRRIRRYIKIIIGKDVYYRTQINYPKEKHGSEHGGWFLCPHNINKDSIVYSFGVGEDISFDLSLIEKYGVDIFAFDPTPRSIQWVKSQKLPEQFKLCEFGIADYDGLTKFFPPENPSDISHTMLYKPVTAREAIAVKVYRLSRIMKMLGHHKIDILKMDIEGAEYDVLKDILNSDIEISQILVEFHHRFENVDISKTRNAVELLNQNQYKLFYASPSGEDYSFLRG